MEDTFKLRICSDLEYEEMVVDICWNNNTVALLNREKGIDNLEIEIFPPDESNSWKFPLDKFIETIQNAKKCLIEMN